MATPWQGEPALSESPSLPVAGNKRQRTESQHHQEPLQQNRSQGASQGLCLPTTGYDVLLVGERSYTQVLAKALLEVSENNVSSSSASTPSSPFDKALSLDVDRLAIDALQRTLSNETSVSAIWKRRHVHMVESLASTMTSTTPSATASIATATSQHDAAAGDSNVANVDVDRMNHIVIVVPTAFSPDVWETVPLHSKVQRELDAIISQSPLRESLLLRQRVSLVAIVGGAYNSVTTSTPIHDKTSNKAYSHVPVFLCHNGQDASFHCTARQLWKRIAIGTRTDPVSTVSPLLLVRKHRE